MNVFVAVNKVHEIGYRQTTALLIASFVCQGHQVALADVTDFQFQASTEKDGFEVFAVLLKPETLRHGQIQNFDTQSLASFVQQKTERTRLDLAGDSMIFIRTNPGRDQRRAANHRAFIDYCCSAKLAGIPVINDPFALPYFASKSALACVDRAYRPAMMVSEDRRQIVEFIQQSQTNCIVKPVVGTRGQDVLRVSHDETGLFEILNSTFAGQSIVAQHFILSDDGGDKRVIVVDGKVLELDGQVAGIHRQPAEGDFRANLHAGGSAHRLTLTDRQREVVEHGAQLLNSHGIRLAGIDLIGTKIIEFNVFSTGGLFDCQKYTGLNFSDQITRVLLEECN